MSDNQSIEEWITVTKKQWIDKPTHRDGYLTYPTIEKTCRLPDFFTDAENHQTIYAESVFAPSEKIKVALESLDEFDHKNNIDSFLTSFHRHDFFELVYVYKGYCTTTIEGDVCVLKEGDICLYNMEAIHQLGIDNEETAVFNILMKRELFDHTFMQLIDYTNLVSGFFMRSLQKIASPSGHLVFSLTKENDACKFANRIIAEFYTQKDMYKNMIYSNLVCLFISLSRQYQNRIVKLSGKKSKIDIEQVLVYIASNVSSITLDKLSTHFSYTPRSMMRLIRKYTYRTFSDILTEFKMATACSLLREKKKSIDEIAAEIGYNDRSYFDKVFKRMLLMTPARYRKEN